jgi:hypothetical protein
MYCSPLNHDFSKYACCGHEKFWGDNLMEQQQQSRDIFQSENSGTVTQNGGTVIPTERVKLIAVVFCS